jgi:hypothetical protein
LLDEGIPIREVTKMSNKEKPTQQDSGNTNDPKPGQDIDLSAFFTKSKDEPREVRTKTSTSDE